MTREESLVYQLIGTMKHEIKAFACALKVLQELLFEQERSIGDIKVTKDVYPEVAKRMQIKERTAARQIELMGNLCWDSMGREEKLRYVGRALNDIHGPQDMIFYLAFYCHFNKPFYVILEEEFQMQMEGARVGGNGGA